MDAESPAKTRWVIPKLAPPRNYNDGTDGRRRAVWRLATPTPAAKLGRSCGCTGKENRVVQIKILIKTIIYIKNSQQALSLRLLGQTAEAQCAEDTGRHWEHWETLVLVCLQRALCEVWWRPVLQVWALASLTSEASPVSPGQQVSGQKLLL